MARNDQTPYDVGGRTVFITGAARGIGAETARRLHGKGANVALVGLEPERLQALAAELGGDRAAAFEADVTDYEALERAVAATVERFGGIDVGIANAGIAFEGPLASAPIEQVERTFAVNFLGVWRTDRALIAQITERKGYLLNISSVAAVAHLPLMGPYTASKAGVEALSNVLRMESAPSGARVGCAYFGFIDTDLVRAGQTTASSQAMNSGLPGFLNKPAPVATAVNAIERGIERRADRVLGPRWISPMLTFRSALQPLTERLVGRNPERLREGMRVAAAVPADEHDPMLGVAMHAVEK